MIELCDDCEYVILIADLIATLMVYDKDDKPFKLKIWCNQWEMPLEFESDCFFNFLQEGLRVENKDIIQYVYYDIINLIEVVKC